MDKPTVKARAGRPAFKPSSQQRAAVSIGAGAGMTHGMLAAALAISRTTLERHFKRELSAGAAAKRLEVLRALFTAAKKGNVAAIKHYLLMGATPPAPREVPLGKKEAARRAAPTAHIGSDWEDLLDGPVDSDVPLQ